MSKHVLVTGGAGLIGSHLADAYLARGWRVSIVDNLSTGDRANLNPDAKLYEMDIREERTARVIEELRPDVISHHAAQIDVRTSVADPAFDAEINVVASVRLLQTAAKAGVERFIFASSGGAMYGEPQHAPQREDHPVLPLSPYGCAKLSFEHYLDCYREVYGFRTIALRYANVYGPRQNSHGEAGVVAIFTDRMLAGQGVTINGSGEQTRDFVYVGDVVAANMAVSEGDWSGAYNVGTGVETSVNRMYELLAAAMGIDREAAHGPAKAGEQMRSVLDGTKLRKAAGLPEPLGFREGLEKTVAYFRNERR